MISEDSRSGVSFVSPFFPHYRTSLFRVLQSSEHFRYTFVGSATRYVNTGIPGIDPAELGSRIPLHSRALPGGIVWQKGIIKHVRKTRDIAVVVTGDPHHLSTWFAAILARLRGITVLFWTHGWTQHEQRLKATVRKIFYRLASDLLLYGDYAKLRGKSRGFEGDRLHVMSNSMGAPIRESLQRRAGRNSTEGGQDWIVITRLTPAKEIHLVIQAMSILRESGKRVFLTIVGDGPERSRLENEARSAQLDIEFLGSIYDLECTGELLSRADLCISPGAIGLTAIHALSSGCPVATHENPAWQKPEAEAVVDGQTGVRFPYGDVAEMARRSWDFVARADREAIVSACHAEVRRRWTAEAQAAAIERALTASIARSGKRPPNPT